jgi:ATP-dependent Clp protease ATP-binding subunit ClpA
MNDIQKRLLERGIAIELSDEARDLLVEKGYNPSFGARPLKRLLQREVESPLSKRVLKGQLKEGDAVLVDADETGIVFTNKA